MDLKAAIAYLKKQLVNLDLRIGRIESSIETALEDQRAENDAKRPNKGKKRR
jgi:hypothetical protein